jgi:hypothetical protein
MSMPVACFRLPQQMLDDLKALARKMAVQRGTEVSWSMLVRELIADRLHEEGDQRPDRRPPEHGPVALAAAAG